MDLFGLPPLARRRLVLAVPPWCTVYDPSSIFSVPFQLVFQYFSNHGLSSSTELASKREAYALEGFVVWILICFWDAVRAGVPSQEDRDDR